MHEYNTLSQNPHQSLRLPPFWESPERETAFHEPLLETIQTSETENSESSVKWIEKRDSGKKQSKRVVRSLEEMGAGNRAGRMMKCGEKFFIYRYHCGHRERHRIAFLCGDKFCVNCSAVRSRRFVKKFERAKEGGFFEGMHLYHLTLTFKNRATLPDYKTIQAYVKALMKTKLFKAYGYRGAIRSFEVTYNAKKHTFHPHFHLMIAMDEPFPLIETGEHKGEAQNAFNQLIADEWKRITGDSEIVKAKIFGGGFFEMMKYITKPGDVSRMPRSKLMELITWSKGKRFLSLMGEFYDNAELRELMRDDDEDEGGGDYEHCPECGEGVKERIEMRYDKRIGASVPVAVEHYPRE